MGWNEATKAAKESSGGLYLQLKDKEEDIQEAIDVLTEIKNDEIEKLIQRVKEK